MPFSTILRLISLPVVVDQPDKYYKLNMELHCVGVVRWTQCKMVHAKEESQSTILKIIN